MTNGDYTLRTAISNLILDDIVPAAGPSFTVLTGGPGSAPARAIARIIDEFGDQVAVVDPAELATTPGVHDDAAALTVAALQQARARHLSVVAVLPPDDRTTLPIADDFRAAGYRTRLVITAGQVAQDLLSTVSAGLRGMLGAVPGALDSYDDGWAATRQLAASASDAEAIEEVLIVSGRGEFVSASSTDAPELFDAVRTRPMSNLQTVAWLGELRRLTEYTLAASLTESAAIQRRALIRLHDLAVDIVLPSLPIDPSGLVARTQSAALESQRHALRRVAAPAIADQGHAAPGPDLGI